MEMAHLLEELWAAAGLQRYEVSNFARPGRHSRHNSLYWTGGEYLALGAGATGFLLDAGSAPDARELELAPGGTGVRSGVRYDNLRSVPRYLEATGRGALPEEHREALGTRERFEERLALGLRLATGVDLGRLCALAGESLPRREGNLKLMAQGGLAQVDQGRVVLTRAGLDVHGAVCARLF
jgi:oxygen-independent coproporphyrinogen-3 oxidase